jgi:Co/Zn/Cd efflux system component
MRGGDGALSAGETTASKAALLEDAHSDGDASPASQAALLEDGSAGHGTKPPPRCASPRNSSHAALLEDVALDDDETPAADTADGGCCCCRNERCTNHAKVLTVALVLFLSITCAQFGLALLARSNTLLVDCASMLVDSATYAGNLWAVCRETNDPEDAARGALVTSGLSILVLAAITAWGLSGAVSDLRRRHPPDRVNAEIVLILGIFGLVFDAATLLAFRAWGGTDEDEEEGIELVGTGEEHDFEDIERTAEDMNMCSAFSHVAADTIRSVTSVSLGLLIMLRPDLNGAKWDAYATLIVTATVLLGSVHLAVDWCRVARGLAQARRRAEILAKLTPRRRGSFEDSKEDSDEGECGSLV